MYDPVDSPDSTTVFPYHDLTPPTLADVYAARRVVRRHLPRTPLVRSDVLSAELDAEVYLKREDVLPTGAFKVRGGVNLVYDLPEEFRERGLIAASTGNHGQSVAYAGARFDVPVVVAVPEDANPSKVAAMERLGARVEPRGVDFDEAREWAESQAATEGYRYVHSANEPRLVAGVGTAGLEVVEDLPGVDVVVSPVGGGSSASAYCLTVGELTEARVVGVQAASADAVARAYREGHLEPGESADTFAEGLATRAPFALTMQILRERLDGMVTVADDDIRRAMYDLLADDHVLTEGAAAAPLAAARELGDELAGKTVVLPISGGNAAIGTLEDVLDQRS